MPYHLQRLVASLVLAASLFSLAANAQEKPNFIVIFTDDQGYNDLGCFDSKTIKTPNIDRMASEGRKYTSFYVPCSVCSPSRAALLTGCYPKRVGMHKHVLFPRSDHGLSPDEYTIADHLKSIGYATACVGKWHLGRHKETLPRANGFDSYYGIPYSNDMNYPDNKRKTKLSSDELWKDQATAITDWNTPLFGNEEVIELPVDQRTITRRYTDKAIDFVTANKDKPFFLYLPHSMPHIPLYVPDDVYDPDPQNAYKCVIEHIDAEVGRLVQTVRDLGLSENTYIIYTSDNGPWLQFKNHGGSADPLRAGKGTTFEGGQRVPCVMWAPGRIPAGTSTDAFTSTMDLLPTIASITKTELPKRKIDGYDISGTFASDETPRDELIYYSKDGNLQGIRQGDWKYLEITPRKNKRNPNPKTTKYLFNLADDIGEQTNLVESNPDVIPKLKARMSAADSEITKNARPVWRKKKDDAKDDVSSIEQYEVGDLRIELDGDPPKDPFDVDLFATFSHPDGTRMKVPGFYNGGSQYVVRFTAPKPGMWNYRTSALPNSNKHLTGTLPVKPSTRTGGIGLDPDNVRNFKYQNGDNYYPIAFECDWLFALDAENPDDIPVTRKFVDSLAENGFNQIVMNVFAYDVNWKKDDNLNDVHEYGHPKSFPFAGDNTDPDFSTLDVDYFKRLDRVIDYLDQKGIAAHLMIYVWNKKVNWPEANSAEDNRYFDYVVKRYQAYPNIVWDISKEALGYGHSDVTYISDRIDRLRKMDAYKRLVTVHDYGYCRKFPGKLDFISVQLWQSELYRLMRKVSQQFPKKPILNIEHGGYEKSPYVVFTGSYTSPEVCLERAYQCVFAGTYPTHYWQGAAWNVIIPDIESLPAADRPQLQYYRHMRTLTNKYDLANLKSGDQKSSSGFCLHNNDDLFIYYVPKENINIGVRMPKKFRGRKMTGTWFDPFTGEFGEPVEQTVSQWPSFDKPEGDRFAILIVEVQPENNQDSKAELREPKIESSLVNFTTKEDHQAMLDLLGITKLRPGRSGDSKSPNAANTDESKANPYPVLPHLMMLRDGTEVTTPELWWKKRRPEIVEAFESEIVGRVPYNAPSVEWKVLKTEEKTVAGITVIERELNGWVDDCVCPDIQVNISMIVGTPKDANEKVPVLMMHTFTGAEPFIKERRTKFPDRRFGPPPGAPTAEQYLVERGWGYAKISPYTIQADKGDGLTRGIIGVCNLGQPRKQSDWGALRAWAWGASRGLDYLETDPTVDAKRVAIEGVSRFGKAALVTMAFDQRFAAVLVGSSGEGGASLYRRNFGESVENLTGSGEYHWMAGSFLKYGAEESHFGRADANNLPIDSHQLIALCAPRPTFISYGIPEKGDALWLDQQGSFMAAIAAQPAFRLLGAKDLGRSDDYMKEKMPPVNEGLLDGHLAWRQHDGGHTDLPNMVHFIEWADKLFGRDTPKLGTEKARAQEPKSKVGQISDSTFFDELQEKIALKGFAIDSTDDGLLAFVLTIPNSTSGKLTCTRAVQTLVREMNGHYGKNFKLRVPSTTVTEQDVYGFPHIQRKPTEVGIKFPRGICGTISSFA